jgi:hypothetical protein
MLTVTEHVRIMTSFRLTTIEAQFDSNLLLIIIQFKNEAIITITATFLVLISA